LKPARFQYDDPRTLGEALGLLAEHGEDAKVLAGGQSLVPMLNFRLAQPERLIDVNRIGELAYVQRREGVLRIGALTRHTVLERSKLVAENWPLLTEAMRWVAHPQIRNRGTVGGSVAHADPAAELPVAFAALDARFTARSLRGDRVIPWEDFFVTHLTTTLEPDELLAEIEVPKLPERSGYAFTEFARRHGDFGLGGAAVMLSMDSSGACERASIALLAAAPTPLRARKAEDVLRGVKVDAESAAAAARAAVEGIEPTGDIHGSSEYRIHLIEALVRRGLLAAAADAEARRHG
jgi:carbon-monoxide dehydrogenase medium subunit/6-hydroxypseudooxynicotine dehydrogenase subunit alpha